MSTFAEQVIRDGSKIIEVELCDDGSGTFYASVIDSDTVTTAGAHGKTPEEAVIALMQSNPMG